MSSCSHRIIYWKIPGNEKWRCDYSYLSLCIICSIDTLLLTPTLSSTQVIPEILDEYKSLNPELNVLPFCSQFIPNEVILFPKYETIIYHPSILPRHRGASAINWWVVWMSCSCLIITVSHLYVPCLYSFWLFTTRGRHHNMRMGDVKRWAGRHPWEWVHLEDADRRCHSLIGTYLQCWSNIWLINYSFYSYYY